MAKGMESVAMAQNQSSSGLSITSVYCRKTTGGVSEFQELVIVRDAVKNKTLVVGESKLSSAMLQALAQSSLVYINGTDSRAERDIDLQISSLLAGKPKTDELAANLLNAFYLRHRREDESKPGDKLSRTIASKRPALIAPQYLFAQPASSESAKTAQPRRSR
jgi:hypothetical protein